MAKPSKSPAEAGEQITRHEYGWTGNLGEAATVTYAYRNSADTDYPGGSDKTFARFTDYQIEKTELILQLYSDVAGITFDRVNDSGYSDAATILFANYKKGNDGAAAFTYLPVDGDTSGESVEGDLWYNLANSAHKPKFGSYDFQTLLHEIGHTLGLEHPGSYNAFDGKPITYGNSAVYREDTIQFTNMSYFDASHSGADHTDQRGKTWYGSTPLLDDITAMQRLYGANLTTRTGDDTYGFNSNVDRAVFHLDDADEQFVVCIYDCGGDDTLDFSGYGASQKIRLAEGAFSNIGELTKNVAIALGTVIENAIGGRGRDLIVGNSVDNELNGDSGADILKGRGGSDTLIGGLGKDKFVFDFAPGGGDFDTIADFAVGLDLIVLDKDAFGGLGATGELAAGRFVLGAAALDAGDRILYDAASHALYFDADGTGAIAAVKFAEVDASLTAASFLIVA